MSYRTYMFVSDARVNHSIILDYLYRTSKQFKNCNISHRSGTEFTVDFPDYFLIGQGLMINKYMFYKLSIKPIL